MIFPANETSMYRGFASHVGLPEGSRSVLEQLELLEWSWNLKPRSMIGIFQLQIPSGKRTHITNWKITMLFMGKSTIFMAIFNSYVTNYQRVYPIKSHKTTIFLWFSYSFPMVIHHHWHWKRQKRLGLKIGYSKFQRSIRLFITIDSCIFGDIPSGKHTKSY